MPYANGMTPQGPQTTTLREDTLTLGDEFVASSYACCYYFVALFVADVHRHRGARALPDLSTESEKLINHCEQSQVARNSRVAFVTVNHSIGVVAIHFTEDFLRQVDQIKFFALCLLFF